MESSRKNRALHFIRSVGEAATSENSQSGNPVRLPPPAGICVYRVCVCMCVYIYTVYTDTPHENTTKIYIYILYIYIYISDIRFLLLAATSEWCRKLLLTLLDVKPHLREAFRIASANTAAASANASSKNLLPRASAKPFVC